MRQGNRRKKVISYSTPYHNLPSQKKTFLFLTLHVLLGRDAQLWLVTAFPCLKPAPAGTPALPVCCFAQLSCGCGVKGPWPK